MLDDPDLYARYLEQVCYLTAYFFNEAYLHARIDEVRDLIAPSVYADANKMYSSADFDTNLEADLTGGGPGPMGGQTYGLKPFVTRAAYIAGELDCSTLSISDGRALDRHPPPRVTTPTLRREPADRGRTFRPA